MSGTGVQSAMRRRMRPPEEQRRTVSTPQNNRDQPQPRAQNNQRQMNPGQILYMHQMKIQEIQKQLENIGVVSNNTSSMNLDNIKGEFDSIIEKKFSILSNNLNFILNKINEQQKTNELLKGEIDRLVLDNKKLTEQLESKMEKEDLEEFKKTFLETKKEDSLSSLETPGTLHSIDISPDINLDNNDVLDLTNVDLDREKDDKVEDDKVEEETQPETQPETETDIVSDTLSSVNVVDDKTLNIKNENIKLEIDAN